MRLLHHPPKPTLGYGKIPDSQAWMPIMPGIRHSGMNGHYSGAAEEAEKRKRRRRNLPAPPFHSHTTNPIIWGCISYTLTGITFANLLIFYLLFLAVNFLSIKIVSQKAGEYNYLLHRFPGYSAIENTLIYRKFSFIALDAFRSGRSRHPWTL